MSNCREREILPAALTSIEDQDIARCLLLSRKSLATAPHKRRVLSFAWPYCCSFCSARPYGHIRSFIPIPKHMRELAIIVPCLRRSQILRYPAYVVKLICGNGGEAVHFQLRKDTRSQVCRCRLDVSHCVQPLNAI